MDSAAGLKAGFLVLILLAVIFEVFADVLFKKWSMENNAWLFAIGLALYSVGTIFWAFSLKYDFLSKAVSVFTIINLVVVVAVGVLFFHEQLTLWNKLGIALGIASIALIEL